MNPQVENYHRNSSPLSHLDTKLAPIFNHIRTNHIHCFRQLKQDHRTSESPFTLPQPHVLPRSIRAHNNKDKSTAVKNKGHEVKYPVVSGRSKPNQQADKMAATLSHGRTIGKSNEKIVLVDSKSKVKRHLVDTIDYLGLENALFQRNPRITRFDHFYKTLINKDRWSTRRNQSLDLNTIQMQLDLKDEPFEVSQDAKTTFTRYHKRHEAHQGKRSEVPVTLKRCCASYDLS